MSKMLHDFVLGSVELCETELRFQFVAGKRIGEILLIFLLFHIFRFDISSEVIQMICQICLFRSGSGDGTCHLVMDMAIFALGIVGCDGGPVFLCNDGVDALLDLFPAAFPVVAFAMGFIRKG